MNTLAYLFIGGGFNKYFLVICILDLIFLIYGIAIGSCLI
jgi:hypothetical protein